jgi:hypothetical protein
MTGSKAGDSKRSILSLSTKETWREKGREITECEEDTPKKMKDRLKLKQSNRKRDWKGLKVNYAAASQVNWKDKISLM